jgi:hypothetical protein
MELLYARAGAKNGEEFCLRFLFNAEVATKDTGSTTLGMCQRLMRDATFHSNYLREAKGKLVPVHYGMWIMDTEGWAARSFSASTSGLVIPWDTYRYLSRNPQDRSVT